MNNNQIDYYTALVRAVKQAESAGRKTEVDKLREELKRLINKAKTE